MKNNRYRKNNTSLYTVLLLLCIIGFWIFENFYTPAAYSDPKAENTPNFIPDFILPESSTGELVKHQYYWLSYSEAYEQSEWVAYQLTKAHLTYEDRERPYFIEDPKVKTKSADWRNYRGSGYDRGHLCPAGDRRFSDYAFRETFYTSNISPQKSDFNSGIWNRLEMKVRSWCKKDSPLYVVTGGVLRKDLESIGEEEVAIPEAFYKIVVTGTEGDLRVLAFLIPHHESGEPLENFLVPIDSLEQLTGIDFFHGLPDQLENNLESLVTKKNWKF